MTLGANSFPTREIVDLEGGFVAPAFVDSHVHLTATGLTLTGLDLRPATSLHALPRAHRGVRRDAPRRPDLGPRLG